MTHLPLTFLFTDLENSTLLWERFPDEMRLALTRHDALLMVAIESHSGRTVKSTGDGFLAVFESPSDAAAAAIFGQKAIAAEPWSEATGPLKVRMGLHTGESQERDGDFYGTSVNRAARVMDLANGGQILLSDVTAALVRAAMPASTTLANLGQHHLKGLAAPENIYQLCHSDLPTEFPSLKSPETIQHNLPIQLTSFIGREKEIDDIKGLLNTAHLVTLTGSGGTGKTRLSQEVGAQVLTNFPHGVWIVELAPLSDAAQIVPAMAQIFRLQELPFQPLANLVLDHLRDKVLLLILDNCEHLIDACAYLADHLLHQCAELKILTSSREALGIAGELAYRIPSLLISESNQLFVERARAANSNFELTEANASSIAQICRSLDGIPLALELAAARIKSLAPEQLADRLDDMFRLLIGGSRTALPRHQTLRALIDWSYNLLNGRERLLLHRLSVFAGGWTLEAAEEICGDTDLPKRDILEELSSLVDKSLVIFDTWDENQAPRYRMLETIRQYAREKLFDSSEGARMRTRHLQFFVSFAEAAENQFYGEGQTMFLNRSQAELENLRAALEWSQKDEFVEAGLRIVGALWQFWFRRGHWTEGFEKAAGLLSHAPSTIESAVRSKALMAASILAWCRDDEETENIYLEQSLVLARELGGRGEALLSLLLAFYGYMKLYQDIVMARTLSEESLLLSRNTNAKWITGLALCTLGQVAEVEGDYVAARLLFEEDLDVLQDIGSNSIMAAVQCNLGGVIYHQGEPETGKAYMEAGLRIYRQLGDRARLTIVLLSLGRILAQHGDYIAARTYLEESLELAQGLGARQQTANAFAALDELPPK
jgi:predicted ATPase/class 3 adenylate cyclase